MTAPTPPHCSAGWPGNRPPRQPKALSMPKPQPPSKTLWRNSSRPATARSNRCVRAASARYQAPAGLAGGSVPVASPTRALASVKAPQASCTPASCHPQRARPGSSMRYGRQSASNCSFRSGAPPTGRRSNLNPARNPVRHHRTHDRSARVACACPACAGFRRRTARHRRRRVR